MFKWWFKFPNNEIYRKPASCLLKFAAQKYFQELTE